ncbi:MAG: hypothetical protein M1837_006672 [Sclerophora amabilis]|nr:MAG: hypothetical protein M1837_006672 [Sclerophora amabilis]
MSEYSPSIRDALSIYDIFSALPQHLILPPSLIDIVLDYASYWPHTLTTISSPLRVTGGHAQAGGQEPYANKLCLTTPPLGLPPPPSDDESRPEKPEGIERTERSDLQDWAPPRGEHPCRKIVFELASHDQGFGGSREDKGAYSHSWTWFDAAVAAPDRNLPVRAHSTTTGPTLPASAGSSTTNTSSTDSDIDIDSDFDSDQADEDRQEEEGKADEKPPPPKKHPFLPPSTLVQSNAVAERETKRHTVTWSWDDDSKADSLTADEAESSGRGRDTVNGRFVRELKIGDSVELWARARFPAWSNHVEEASVRVYWAV